MSTTGVPSIASSGPTFSSRSATSRTVTRCNPRGFGRSGERVAKTPASGTLSSPRGCVFKTSRRASCNQVMTMSSSPATIPSSPSRTDAVSSIHASGAPSLPWLGALLRSLSGDRTMPIRCSGLESRSHIGSFSEHRRAGRASVGGPVYGGINWSHKPISSARNARRLCDLRVGEVEVVLPVHAVLGRLPRSVDRVAVGCERAPEPL